MYQRKNLVFDLLVASAIVSGGCGQPEQVTSYTVPKQPLVLEINHVNPLPDNHPAIANPADRNSTSKNAVPTDRMLGAVIPHGNRAWFFKVTGPIGEVDTHAETIRRFVQSVRFNDDAKPVWNAPDDWQEQPGSGMRFATLVIGPQPDHLELSVIPLPMPAGDLTGYVLSNVNRWRGQLGLDPLQTGELTEHSQLIETDGATATFVDFLGTYDSPGMGNAPFLRGLNRGSTDPPPE